MNDKPTYYDYQREQYERNEESRKFYKKPKHETLAEHRKHCKAEPGKCPFERLYDETDDLVLTDTAKKPDNYERLAQTMTAIFQFGKDVATDMEKEHKDSDAIIGESLNKGLQAMQESVEKAGCIVKMNEDNSQFMILPPQK